MILGTSVFGRSCFGGPGKLQGLGLKEVFGGGRLQGLKFMIKVAVSINLGGVL